MLGSLIAAFIAGETSTVLRRARSAAVAYLVAGLFGLIGVVFAVVAGYILAARRFGPLEAALGAAAIFLVVAVLILVVHRLRAAARARRARKRRGGDITRMAVATGIAAAQSLLSYRKGVLALTAVPIAAAIAYLLLRKGEDESEEEDLD